MGRVTRAVHNVENPSEAPVTAYVPIPDGSSSEAPTIMHAGPESRRKRMNPFGSFAQAASRARATPLLEQRVYRLVKRVRFPAFRLVCPLNERAKRR